AGQPVKRPTVGRKPLEASQIETLGQGSVSLWDAGVGVNQKEGGAQRHRHPQIVKVQVQSLLVLDSSASPPCSNADLTQRGVRAGRSAGEATHSGTQTIGSVPKWGAWARKRPTVGRWRGRQSEGRRRAAPPTSTNCKGPGTELASS